MPAPSHPIPKTGLRDAALREAVVEYRAIIQAVRTALEKAVCTGAPNAPGWIDLDAIYPDAAVIEVNGKSWQYPYTMADDGTVMLGEPVQVVEMYVPAVAVPADARLETEDDGPDNGAMIEAVNAEGQAAGTVWRVWAIRCGLSLNRVDYPPAVLREATPLFDGARVFDKTDDEHLKGQGKATRNLIGQLRNARFVESTPDATGGVQAELHLLGSSGLPPKLLEMWQRGMAGLIGFSIDASGAAKQKGAFREAVSILQIKSLDLIVEPGAGGRLIDLIESEGAADMALRQKMIRAVNAANGGKLPAGLNVDDDDALELAFREAVNKQPSPSAPLPQGEGSKELDALRKRLDLTDMREAVAASGLPSYVQDKLKAKIEKGTTPETLREAIADQRDILAKATSAGHVTGLGADFRIEAGESRAEKITKMFDDFFFAKGVHSFKECYIEFTGDRRVTGDLRQCDMARMREAAGGDENFREAVNTSTFAYTLGDSITRRLIADYRDMGQYDVWQQLTTTPVSLADFRINERTRMGGYSSDLPEVEENEPYEPLTTPSDEHATYKAIKRGGTESISMETIKNDDVGAIRQIPIKLSRAAKRRLCKFVLDFIRLNPVIYDGKTLFHADHNNLGSEALNDAGIAARRLAMLGQTEPGSLEPLSIGPKNLWVPFAQEEAAHNAFLRNTNFDKTFIQSLVLNIIPVWYWTDLNDWAMTADPMDIPTIEIGFLDGRQEPELFVQDMPNVGSMFTNDAITYKLRHIYGGTVLDYRGMQKSVVP